MGGRAIKKSLCLAPCLFWCHQKKTSMIEICLISPRSVNCRFLVQIKCKNIETRLIEICNLTVHEYCMDKMHHGLNKWLFDPLFLWSWCLMVQFVCWSCGKTFYYAHRLLLALVGMSLLNSPYFILVLSVPEIYWQHNAFATHFWTKRLENIYLWISTIQHVYQNVEEKCKIGIKTGR